VLFALATAQQLQTYNIAKDQISVSGLSSGAAMSVQFHVAYSSVIMGAGVLAGPPYWCAMGQLQLATTACTTAPSRINIDLLWRGTQDAFSDGSIDDPANLRKSRVWLFAGKLDTTVYPDVVAANVKYYSKFISGDNIAFVRNISAVHSWVTLDWGNPCSMFGSPYINKCDYDAAGQLLKYIYASTTFKPRTNVQPSNLLTFEQKYYTSGLLPSAISMADQGYLYVPTSCQSKTELCKLLVAFHGCDQGAKKIGTAFVLNTGLNQWAESNQIIVLYPQAQPSLFPYNPYGCWDWWGYSNPQYATQLGPQMKAVRNMVSALVG